MPPLEAFIYPVLLATAVAIYRVGREHGGGHMGAFEWARLAALAAFLGLVAALQMRFALAGRLPSPLALFGAALSISAVAGLVGLHVLSVLRASRGPRRATDDAAA